MKAAVIGVGSMGRNHARVMSDVKGAELVAVCDANKKTSEDIADKYECKAYTNYKKLLKEVKPDIVVIAVPTKMHKDVAITAFKAGANVLLEKPIAPTVKEADEIIKAAKKSKKKLMIGHIERFNPAIVELRQLIKKGQLGKVYKIDINRVGPFPARIRDVGVVIDLAVHDIDIARYLTESEVKNVYATCERQIHTKFEDLLNGILKLGNKMTCMLNINWLTPTKIRKLFITGEKGMFIANYLTQDLYYYENDKVNDVVRGPGGWTVSEGKMIKYHVAKHEPLRSEIEHFISCVKENSKPLITGTDGKKALEIALALIKSSKNGKVVSL